jgi:lipid-A-disaccharide synthase
MSRATAPHIFLVVGEDSGDRLGAALIAAIKRRVPQARFSGVGGAQMRAQGMPSLFPLGVVAMIGFAAIPTRLPKILRLIRETADAVLAANPDALVIIDSPDFTHRIAHRVRARNAEIPIIDYVCPSVWAWRPGRARRMRAYVDQVLALLPFEPAAMERLNGPRTTYVGHPLSERAGDLRPNTEEMRRRAGDPPLLLVLPGSRSGELRRMASIFGETVARIADRIGALEVVVPAVPRLTEVVKAAVATWAVPARVVTDAAEKDAAFRKARAALTKSGTSTLELAIAGVPMVAVYKVSLLEEIVARLLITAQTANLPNLVVGENVVPELFQRDMTPARLAETMIPLFSDTLARRRQLEAFARLDNIMEIGRAVPSERAASLVLDCASTLNQRMREPVASAQSTS